jgi:hypothetical protein
MFEGRLELALLAECVTEQRMGRRSWFPAAQRPASQGLGRFRLSHPEVQPAKFYEQVRTVPRKTNRLGHLLECFLAAALLPMHTAQVVMDAFVIGGKLQSTIEPFFGA